MFGQNSINTAIIKSDIKESLKKYMYFRHVVRHSYSSELDWNEMEMLVKNLEEMWKIIKKDFDLFIKDN
jgi:uncharacterized protein (UPF0332 family)